MGFTIVGSGAPKIPARARGMTADPARAKAWVIGTRGGKGGDRQAGSVGNEATFPTFIKFFPVLFESFSVHFVRQIGIHIKAPVC